jgi:nucleotide-binding universal stress UspA family protein
VKLEKCLVGVDLSPGSSGAVAFARRLLAPAGELRCLHVVDAHVLALGPASQDPTAVMRLREELAQNALRMLATMVTLTGVADASLEVEFGRPADEILAAAERGAELVILGHGATTLERLVTGSVAEEVARRSRIPTLIVPEGADAGPVERVVVAVDHLVPVPSIAALRTGEALARKLGARLEAVHAVSIPPSVYGALGVAEIAFEVGIDGAGRALEAFVEATLARTDVRTRVLVGAPVAEVTRSLGGRDLLVCGTHARGLLGRIAFGSVATGLLRHAPCPIAIVRPED